MKYIEAEKLKEKIDNVVNILKGKCNPDIFGTTVEQIIQTEIETLELVKGMIDEMEPATGNHVGE